MIGSPKFKIGHVTRPLPFQNWFVIHRLELNTINLVTTFEVSTFTHYEDTEGDAKCIN